MKQELELIEQKLSRIEDGLQNALAEKGTMDEVVAKVTRIVSAEFARLVLRDLQPIIKRVHALSEMAELLEPKSDE